MPDRNDVMKAKALSSVSFGGNRKMITFDFRGLNRGENIGKYCAKSLQEMCVFNGFGK